jgi:DNA-3-methyladenine glycosylase I
LLADSGIVRHRGKIQSTINNAQRAVEIVDERGSLAGHFWPHASFGSPPEVVAPTSPTSIALAKDLKRRGWTFVGPTTVYAFMQAMGLVNDHIAGCWARERAEKSRRRAARLAR